jgi:hypothetical protein
VSHEFLDLCCQWPWCVQRIIECGVCKGEVVKLSSRLFVKVELFAAGMTVR